jgi:hypothetical protein
MTVKPGLRFKFGNVDLSEDEARDMYSSLTHFLWDIDHMRREERYERLRVDGSTTNAEIVHATTRDGD